MARIVPDAVSKSYGASVVVDRVDLGPTCGEGTASASVGASETLDSERYVFRKIEHGAQRVSRIRGTFVPERAHLFDCETGKRLVFSASTPAT